MTTFKKSLNLFDATSIVMGSMIGSGIFIVSADVARAIGAPGWLLVAWAVAGVMTIMAALCFGELSCIIPRAGGQYVYLREVYNPLTGFLYGWTLFTVINTGTIAAVAMAFAKFTGVLIPAISSQHVILDLGFTQISTVNLVAMASIAVLTWINTRGIEEGKTVQNIFTSLKVFILLAFIATGLVYSFTHLSLTNNHSYFWNAASINPQNGGLTPLGGFSLLIALAIAMVGPVFSLDAWYDIVYAAEEVKNPSRNIPLSMILGTLIVALLFLLVNWVYISVLPLRGSPDGATVTERGIQFAAEDRVGTAAIYTILGKSAEVIMAIIIMISTFGCNNGIILAGARVYYTMARDGLFFKQAAQLNQRQVPALSLTIQGIWSCILCLSGSYSQLLDYVIFAMLMFNFLTVLAVFILRHRRPSAPERTFKTPGYPLTPLLYMIMCLFLLGTLLIYKPLYTWPGLILIATGIPVYYLIALKNKLTSSQTGD